MVKKNLLLLVVIFLFISCESGKQSAQAASEKGFTKGYAVTFIELGSVRCTPCRMMTPVLDAVKKKYPGKVNVIFYDVWTEAGKPYAQQYRIRAIPTQIFLDASGKEYFRHIGFFPLEKVEEVIKKKLK